MKNIIIMASKSNGMIDLPPTKVIGREKENLQAKLVFKFKDEFINGQARLEYELDYEKHYIIMDKVDETYEVPIKNIMLINGDIYMQLVITEPETGEGIPVYKSNTFFLHCDPSINAVTVAPEGFEDWITRGDAKLNLIDEALEQVDNLDIDAERVEDGVEITITKKDGTTETVKVNDGQGGSGGTINHNELENLDYEHSGHTGFQPSGNYVEDANYVHTDNNYTNEEKLKLSNLENYDDTEIKSLISQESQNRQTSDNNLQSQIDAITSASDVVDVVGTYAELQAYDTQHLKDNDIVKVLVDESKSNAITYYRWDLNNLIWVYIGNQGPFYTKSESDSKFVEKETGKSLSTNDYTTAEKTKLGNIEAGAEVNNVDDVKVNGTSVVDANKVANIDISDDLIIIQSSTANTPETLAKVSKAITSHHNKILFALFASSDQAEADRSVLQACYITQLPLITFKTYMTKSSRKTFNSIWITGTWENDVFTATRITANSSTPNDVAITLGNTASYTPTGNYNPATKKYVDDSIASAITDALGGNY